MTTEGLSVLLVNGSPNKNGCTNKALKQIQEKLQEENINSQIYQISNDIKGCIDCGKCSRIGKCIFDDEVNSFV